MSNMIITGGTVLTINDADDVHFGGHVVWTATARRGRRGPLHRPGRRR